MIALFWSRATRDLLKSFGWGIAATPSVRCSDEVATFPRRPPHSIFRFPASGDAPHRPRGEAASHGSAHATVVAMRVEDYYPGGKRWWLRLHEKGGKRHEMPVDHELEHFLDEYVAAAGIRDDGKTPFFRSTIGKTGVLTEKPLNRIDAYRMMRRRTAEPGFKIKLGCHVFRATGITAYLEAGGTLENAQAMAAHESPRTTKLYDRTGDEITLDEVERIGI